MALDDYRKAQKKGQKSYQHYVMAGKYPYLSVLDEILSHTEIVSEQKLGLVQIPMERIVGTLTAGRRTSFAPNFMPLLDEDTEFASKWSRLCDAHLNEGIRDPIKAYEFMNRYYVVEGNKRVSVLRYFGAVAVPGNVTRVIPKRTDEPENRLYYEFLDFNRRTGVNFLVFSQPGSYRRLLTAMGRDPVGTLDEEERDELRSAYARFCSAYKEKSGDNEKPVTASDAMLVYMEVYSYAELCGKMPAELKEDIAKIADEIRLGAKEQPAEIMTEPSEAPKKNLIERLLPSGTGKRLKIAFIHDKNKETSAWTYGHELGRMYLEDQFPGEVETICIDNVTKGEALEAAFEKAAAEKCNVIFTTTPQFLETSVKEAVKHPQIKILNCSVNPLRKSVRSYYARLYEAKFLSGILAGSLCAGGDIGYVADYPICGMIANINAFAMGARMVNPRARIHLEWTSVRPKEDILRDFKAQGIHIVSCQELAAPADDSRAYGLISIRNEEAENLALTIWHWGVLYKKLIQGIRNGSWKAEDPNGLAVNYWWGMSADVIDFICSQKIPEDTRRLIRLVKQEICRGEFYPFSGIIRTQSGVLTHEEKDRLSPEEIISMNWLAENVIGELPVWGKLSDEAKAVVDVQGVESSEEK